MAVPREEGGFDSLKGILILKTPRKHYRVPVRSYHWQLRSLISAEKNHLVYFPGGPANNDVQRLDTETGVCDTIKYLPFIPRCLVAQNNWLCCGGEHGDFSAIRLDDSIGGAEIGPPRAGSTPTSPPPNVNPGGNNSSSGTGTGTGRIAKSLRLAQQRVNCVTLWFPPPGGLAHQAVYREPVAVLANNDKTVTIVSLAGFEAGDHAEPLEVVSYPDFVNRATISPDGLLLAAVLDDPFLYVHRRDKAPRPARPHRSQNPAAPRFTWHYRNRILLKSQRQDDHSEHRGSFAACFSHSGNVLAVGTQYGTVSIFHTGLLPDPLSDPLVVSFQSSRPRSPLGAIRDMAFCPGTNDLLAWTEDRGRVGIVDIRSHYAVRQILDITTGNDFESIAIVDHSAIDPRLLDGGNGVNVGNVGNSGSSGSSGSAGNGGNGGGDNGGGDNGGGDNDEPLVDPRTEPGPGDPADMVSSLSIGTGQPSLEARRRRQSERVATLRMRVLEDQLRAEGTYTPEIMDLMAFEEESARRLLGAGPGGSQRSSSRAMERWRLMGQADADWQLARRSATDRSTSGGATDRSTGGATDRSTAMTTTDRSTGATADRGTGGATTPRRVPSANDNLAQAVDSLNELRDRMRVDLRSHGRQARAENGGDQEEAPRHVLHQRRPRQQSDRRNDTTAVATAAVATATVDTIYDPTANPESLRHLQRPQRRTSLTARGLPIDFTGDVSWTEFVVGEMTLASSEGDVIRAEDGRAPIPARELELAFERRAQNILLPLLAHRTNGHDRPGRWDHDQAIHDVPPMADNTAGLAWSDDGHTLFVGAQDGIYEFHVNSHARNFFPSMGFR